MLDNCRTDGNSNTIERSGSVARIRRIPTLTEVQVDREQRSARSCLSENHKQKERLDFNSTRCPVLSGGTSAHGQGVNVNIHTSVKADVKQMKWAESRQGSVHE